MRKYITKLFGNSQKTKSFVPPNNSPVTEDKFNKFKEQISQNLSPFSDVPDKEASDLVGKMLKWEPELKHLFTHVKITEDAKTNDKTPVSAVSLNKAYSSLDPVVQEMGIALAKIFLSVKKHEEEVANFTKLKPDDTSLEIWAGSRIIELSTAIAFYMMEVDTDKIRKHYKTKVIADLPLDSKGEIEMFKLVAEGYAGRNFRNSLTIVLNIFASLHLTKIAGIGK